MDPSTSQFELLYPQWLVALAALPLLIFYSRRSLTGFGRFRQGFSLAVRSMLVVLVVLALSGPRIVKPTHERFVVFAVDRSASIAPDAEAVLRPYLDEARRSGKGRFCVLPFGEEPTTVAGQLPKELGAGTNLAATIQGSRAMLPPDYVPHVVLFSDGNPTEGDALAAARAAAVPISTVSLPARADPEVYVSAVLAPGQVRDGEPLAVDVAIHASRDDQGQVELTDGARLVERRAVRVVRGENLIRFRHAVVGRPMAELRASLVGFRDTIRENNAASALVMVVARPRVLLVENEALLAERLAAALAAQQIDVRPCQPDGFPKSAAELQQYDLVILSNVPAAAMTTPQMQLVRGYVRDFGGGLIVVGGDQAFTPGGYRGTLLESVLPVTCEYEPKQTRASVAMLLVIDRSGSMQGAAIELAKEATRRAVDMLQAQDQVGVVAFEDSVHWVSQLHPCSDKQHVLQRIDTVTAGGGTDMYSAMEKAWLALDAAAAERKHMIVLSDGVSQPADFEGLVRRMAESGITVSTVAVGQEAVRPLLEDIARLGGGHSYFCSDPASVPKIFALDTATATRMGIIEEPFSAKVVRPAAAIRGLGLQTAPRLLGYVQTRPKPAGQLILSSEQGDPLLIWWRYGRGISVAFTSDAQSRWAAAWVRWPGFGRFWTRLVRHAMRKDDAEDFVLALAQRDGRATIVLDAADPSGRLLSGADVSARVLGPDRAAREISLPQTAPGRYAADFPARAPGRYLVEANVRYGGQTVYSARRGLAVGYADELRTRPTNVALLQSLAASTGGTFQPKPAEVFGPDSRTVLRTVGLWHYLLLAAAIAFVLDVAVRRLVWRR